MHFHGAGKLKEWLQDFFGRALEWALAHPSALDMPRVGIIRNALSHLAGVATRRAFAVGLAWGFSANMAQPERAEFLAELSRWTGESGLLAVPAGINPLEALR